MLNAFEVAIHDSSGLSPDMMQKLTYKLTHVLQQILVIRHWQVHAGLLPVHRVGRLRPQTKPGSRCLVDI